MLKIDKLHFGEYCEYKVIANLLRFNFDIFLPIVDDKGIDCIIRKKDGSITELQIKGRQPRWIFNIGRFKPRKNYFFALIPPDNKIYVVPSFIVFEWLGGRDKFVLSQKRRLQKYIDAYDQLS